MNKKLRYIGAIGATLLCGASCNTDKLAEVAPDALVPTIVSQVTPNDTDDPAIWIDSTDITKSMVLGTDKDTNGGLYLFGMDGKILKHYPLKRPNNVDVAYGLKMPNGKKVDIAVVTERETNKIRVFSLPAFQPIDNGGIDVFADADERSPMGIALYTRKDGNIYAIVGRKSGPKQGYLYQYLLECDEKGIVTAKWIRAFGAYSGKKEIEAIAVDNELGFVYYSDEKYGVHKYHADPDHKDISELALFANEGFVSDHEGISIYKTTDSTGYILVSNQQNNSFMVYPREGSKNNSNAYPLLKEIPVSAVESDGSEVTNLPVSEQFPKGVFIAMSNGRTFHFYDWRQIEARIKQ